MNLSFLRRVFMRVHLPEARNRAVQHQTTFDALESRRRELVPAAGSDQLEDLNEDQTIRIKEISILQEGN